MNKKMTDQHIQEHIKFLMETDEKAYRLIKYFSDCSAPRHHFQRQYKICQKLGPPRCSQACIEVVALENKILSIEDEVQVAPAITTYQLEPGRTHPVGATPNKDGVNFSIFSEHATSIELLLFNKPDDPEPIQIIWLK